LRPYLNLQREASTHSQPRDMARRQQ